MVRWISLAVVLIALSVCLALGSRTTNPAGLEAALIGANLTVAVLAINFSSLAYQASEYRQFQRGLSPNLLTGFLVVLLWSLTPVTVLVFSRSLFGIFGLAALPITALLSVLLVAWTKYEASPYSLIRQLSNTRRWREAIRAYARKIENKKQALRGLKLSEPGNMPSHEWDWVTLPTVSENDPFTILGSIGCTAAKSGNASAVGQASESLLRALDVCYSEIQAGRERLPTQTASLIESQLERLAITAENVDSTGSLSGCFLGACADYLANKTKDPLPLASPCRFVITTMVASGQRWLDRHKPATAKPALVLVSQLCRKGVERQAAIDNDKSEPDPESLFWNDNVGHLAAMLKPLGSAAIKAGESEYLYRVFDALGWLGCAAIKNDNWIVTTECIQALAQLGREARAGGLECHWESCAVQPCDHAGERIGWIATWIPKRTEEMKSRWLELCSQGFSRLNGKVTTATKGDRSDIRFAVSDEPYKERFFSDAGSRELDYSNWQMLKDFALHGHSKGIVVKSSPIPIKTESEDETVG